jgi:hypothetical protein
VYSDTTKILGVSYNQWHQTLTDAINLSHIDKGVDSFELRLWCDAAMTNISIVTILKYTDSTWRLNQTRYWTKAIGKLGESRRFSFDSSETKKVIPDLAFEQIFDSLQCFRLDTLPTQLDIPNFRDKVADGMTYIIEVSTKKYYRQLSYSNPFYYDDPYNKQASNFLKFMAQHLNAFVIQ